MLEKLFGISFKELLPEVDGDFVHIAAANTNEQFDGKHFWIYNEVNRDFYYSFGSPTFMEDTTAHFLDGKKCDSFDISWNSTSGSYTFWGPSGDLGSSEQTYFEPLGYCDGVYLMYNRSGLRKRIEVLIATEKEAEYRAEPKKIREAIERIRKVQEQMQQTSIISAEDKKKFWKLHLPVGVVLLIIPFLVNRFFLGLGWLLGILVVGIYPVIVVVRYRRLRFHSRASYFAEHI